MPHTWIGRIANWIVDHPRWNILFLIVATVFFGWGYYDPHWIWPRKLDSDKDTQRVSVSNSRSGNQGSNSRTSESSRRAVAINQADVVIVATSDRFFTNVGATAMRAVVAALEDEPTVDNILWLDRAPPLNIFGLPEPIFPRSDASPERFEAARQKALDHPLIVGQLMSADSKTLLLLLRLDWLHVRSDADCTDRIKQIAVDAAARYPEAGIQFQLTGDVPMNLSILSTQRANQLKYQLIGYGMILLLAVILFRGISAVLITAMGPVVGVFWTLGALRYLDLQDNPFNDVVLPIMISLIGFTDGVHMMVQIRKQRALGLSPIDATKKGLHDVGTACLLTLFTTSLGFASLGWAHHQIVREFGWCCVLGIGILFVAVVGVIPLLTASRWGRNLHIGHDRSIVDRNLNKISFAIDFVIRHARVVSYLGIALTLGLAGTALCLRPDDRLANALPAGSEPQRAMEHLDDVLGGLQMSEVRVHWNDQVPNDDPEIFKVVAEIQALLEAQTLIGHPLSITRLIAALPGDGPVLERITTIELLPPPLKNNYYEPEDRLARLTFRVQDRGIAAYGPVFQLLEKQLAELQEAHPDFQLELAGRAVSRWRNLYQIVVDLGGSLGGEALIILVLLGFAYRSVRLGLIAFVPNIFPLAVTGATLVLVGQPLELVSVCAFTVCLGIAVDDTIHFLTRYKEELASGLDEVSAVRQAFTGVGTGMIMTTIVLVAGFSTVLMSEVRDHRVFCSMGALTLMAALLGDILLLPALLVHFRKRPRN